MNTILVMFTSGLHPFFPHIYASCFSVFIRTGYTRILIAIGLICTWDVPVRVCVRVYVYYIHIYMHVYIYIYLCVYVYINIYMYVCVHMYIYIRMYKDIYIYIYCWYCLSTMNLTNSWPPLSLDTADTKRNIWCP